MSGMAAKPPCAANSDRAMTNIWSPVATRVSRERQFMHAATTRRERRRLRRLTRRLENAKEDERHKIAR